MNDTNPPTNATNGRAATVTSSSVINLILGAWLFISNWIIGYTMLGILWSNVIAGAVIFILAAIRLGARSHAGAPSWINALIGAWVIISPFAFNASVAQRWNCVIAGAIVVIFGFASGSAGVARHA
ncbi:MAG TPA: SPW repeat protein [Opitutus sp.]|nr:SPW repeat protein [Opitutus sp.]